MSDKTLGLIILCVAATLIVAAIGGPARISRNISSWQAEAYGSSWLVIQYSQSGSIINHWELKKKSIGNEENSDGIFFVDEDSNVVHLSGHYVYIQVCGNFDKLKKRYLK